MTRGESRGLAVVVLSHGEGGAVAAAVESALAQEPPVEVVVSHSGGDPAAERLARRFPDVAFSVSTRLRLPGAARNAGVAATSAPFVAFLASDCLAEPGWAAGRLARHEAGAAAVGSALAPLGDDLPELACHLLQHSGRAVHVVARPAFRFGASYSRAVLAEHGPFPEDLEFAEDMVVNLRLLAAGIEIERAPEVVTRHAYPSTIAALLRDQHRRARRRAGVQGNPAWRGSLVARSLAVAPVGAWRLAAAGSPVPRRRLAAALPLVAAGALSAAAGSLRGGPANAAAEAERRLHRSLRAASAEH